MLAPFPLPALRLLAVLALLLIPCTALAQVSPDDSPDRRASLIQGSVNGTLTYIERALAANAAGDTAAVGAAIRQARGRVRATLTNTLILRVLLRDTLVIPPPVDTVPPAPVDTVPDEPPPIVVEEPDANPSEQEPAPVDTSAVRLHVVEDIRAVGNVVTLKFRPGWAQHDSIQATSSTGSLTRNGLSWTLNSTAPATVTLKVWQTLPDALGRVKTASPSYSVWIPNGPPAEVTIPASIDATGTEDVCAATGNLLQSWLASLPNNSVIRGADGARYRCDYGIALVDRWNLTFTGRVTLFTAYDADGTEDSNRRQFRLLEFDRGGNIAIDGWTFRGPRPVGSTQYDGSKETQHGLEFNGVNGITLNNIGVEQVWGDFVNLSFKNTKWGEGLFSSEPSRHVEISTSTFTGAGRQGIAMTGLYDARIHDNLFADVQRSLWDFEPGGTWEWIQDVEIANNRIVGRVRNNVVAGHGSGVWMQNITIQGNDFGQKPFRMSFGGNTYRRNYQIIGNTARAVLNSPLSAIEISGVDQVTVIGNTMVMACDRNKPAVLIQNQRTLSFTVEGNTTPCARVQYRVETDKRDLTKPVYEDGALVDGTLNPK